MGPILILDKSAFQNLSLDEVVWLHRFYHVNVTPLFLVEVLGDLSKEMRGGRTAADVVGDFARKTLLAGPPNVHHDTLCRQELQTGRLAMRRVPVIPPGRKIVTANRTAVLIKESPEMEALRRWHRKEFLDVERQFARRWRVDLLRMRVGERMRLSRLRKAVNLKDAKGMAERVLDADGSRYRILQMCLDIFHVSSLGRVEVISRWKQQGGPPLSIFAPYCHHVVWIDAFLDIAVRSNLIGTRPSNRVDIAYLYYLPFCMVFASSDRIHERTVPLFLSGDQIFVSGADLKRDLGRLNEYYLRLPEEIRRQGVMRFASYPPTEGDFLVSELWDRLMKSTWREDASRPPLTREAREALLQLVDRNARIAS
jgi:hypothetical protein